MRTPWRWSGCSPVVAVAILAVPVSGYSACAPAGTPGDDTIVCTGTDDVGVTSGDGDDKVTVRPHAVVSRTDRQETSRAPAEATTATIDAGAGQNSIRTHGTVAANAVAVSQEDAPRAQATALAISVGIPWLGGGDARKGKLKDVIDNAGIITVTADSAATISVRSMPANTTGESAADATGIRAGQAGADVTNAGSLGVLAQTRTHLHGEPDTTSESAQASTVATAAATATGISVAGGDNRVRNDGTIRVEAVIRDLCPRRQLVRVRGTPRRTPKHGRRRLRPGLPRGPVGMTSEMTVVSRWWPTRMAWRKPGQMRLSARRPLRWPKWRRPRARSGLTLGPAPM